MNHIRPVILWLVILLSLPSVAQQTDTVGVDGKVAADSSRATILTEVTITAKKPVLELLPGKMVVHVDAAVTNAGATLMEVLEKTPGVTLDKSGSISLKGRQGVMLMIDGKPALLTGTDLNNLLSSLSASQVDLIEVIDNPGARYDAAGNAGIINIKTKKNAQRGFNGYLNLSLSQGRYTRSLNHVGMNYYSGRVNWFANITGNINQNFTNLYAIRSYYAGDNHNVTSVLEQPSYFKGTVPSQIIKTGIDYHLNKTTTVGAVFSQSSFQKKSDGNNIAIWMDEQRREDSVISTNVLNKDRLNNYAVNLNGKHIFSSSRELTADVDFIGYRIRNNQFYHNRLMADDGYEEEITGILPSTINIYTAKADYTDRLSKSLTLEAGWKSSHVKTNNKAEYFKRTEGISIADYDKTNHFLYKENIHAFYANLEKKYEHWQLQGGLRYERTAFDAHQLGNEVRKDSSFARRYHGLFPSMLVSWDADSNHTWSFTAGRRIDRPPFQTLNPFIFIINKYTYQAGNPFYRPQYTWNLQFSHSFKKILVSTLSYSATNDYFSQIFLQDSLGIITYTEGNLDRMENFGLSMSLQWPVVHWWTVSAMAAVNHKKISGIVWEPLSTARTQANFNVNNQFTWGSGWSGELSGFLQLHEQELQEITDPTGQVGFGVSKQVLGNSASVKLSFRDIFYTQAMKGFTVFENSTEYFKIKRDSRMVNLAFSYRFGRQATAPARRNTGGAEDEMRRAGGQQ